MIWLLKWYYGYKNFGDEVLLLWVIPYVFKNYPLTHLYIESADTVWLKVRLDRHAELLGEYVHQLTLIEKHTAKQYHRDELFLWWGEVLTDGRPFPYNGRNYLFRYPQTIFRGAYHLLWGIWTPWTWISSWLWKLLVWRAKTVIVRETRSYEIVVRYRGKENTMLYHDFAEDVLPRIIKDANIVFTQKTLPAKHLLNTNPYIWSAETKQKLISFARNSPHAYYFPAEIGVDDQFFDELASEIPWLVYYDRTQYALPQICQYISFFSGVIAARLHVLRLAKLLHIPFEPLVYQEKISTFLEQCSGESL